MAHTNPKSNLVVSAELEEEIRRKKALEDLAEINIRIDESRAEEAAYESRKSDIVALDTAIEKKKEEIVVLEQKRLEVERAGQELYRVNENIERAKEEEATLLSLITSKLDEIEKLTSQGVALSRANETAESQIKSLEDRRVAKEKEIADMESYLQKRIASAEEAREKVEAAVVAENEKLDASKKELASLVEKRAEVQKEVDAHSVALVDLANKQRTAVKASEDYSAAFEIRKVEQEKNHAGREALLVAREGAVSDKEAWLSDKEAKLRKYKAQLEEFFGKKIDTIVI